MEGAFFIDERRDVLFSLEHCAMSLRETEQSEGAWKWVVLSFHSAFQGAMICHLSGSAQLDALKKECAKRWLKWYERKRQGEIEFIYYVDEDGLPICRVKNKKDQHPAVSVAYPPELFTRLWCENKRFEKNGAGSVISITEQQKESFKRFNDLRNEFTHFSPRIWNIEIDLIKERMRNVLDIFDLIIEDPYPFRHTSDVEKSAMRSKLADIRSLL